MKCVQLSDKENIMATKWFQKTQNFIIHTTNFLKAFAAKVMCASPVSNRVRGFKVVKSERITQLPGSGALVNAFWPGPAHNCQTTYNHKKPRAGEP